MIKETIFFGEKGLTSTSANNVANLAKEMYRKIEFQLNNIRFINTDIQVLGSEPARFSDGISSYDLGKIKDNIATVAKFKSLIAWLREGIKAKEDRVSLAKTYTLEDYLEEKGLEIPRKYSSKRKLSEQEYFAQMPLALRNRYFELETKVTNLGKLIHEGGAIANARNAMHDNLANRILVVENGRDTIMYTRSSSVPVEQVDSLYMELQDIHRNYQKELNSMKYQYEEYSTETEKEIAEENIKLVQEWTEFMDSHRADYQKAYTEQLEEAQNLKIIIPDSLQDVYNSIKDL